MLATPYSSLRELAAELQVVPGAGHNDLHLFPSYREAARRGLAAR